MPSIAQTPPSPIFAGRKRRRDFDEYGLDTEMKKTVEVQMKIAASPHKAHLQTNLSHTNQINPEASLRSKPQRPISPHASYKRLRPNDPLSLHVLEDKESRTRKCPEETQQILSLGRQSARIDLSPCHICHRKPSELRHLDDYAECEACGRRTCFVCIRQCEGLGIHGEEDYLDGEYDLTLSWHGDEMCVESARREDDCGVDLEGKELSGAVLNGGVKQHSGKVCSQCCVERGPEGEVWCLECLRVVDRD